MNQASLAWLAFKSRKWRGRHERFLAGMDQIALRVRLAWLTVLRLVVTGNVCPLISLENGLHNSFLQQS